MATRKTPPNPADVAATILTDKGLGRTLPTDIHALLKDEVADVQFFTSARGVEGRVELLDGRPAIFVNTRGRDPSLPRTRFTFAHEAGHFFLHRHHLRSGQIFRDDRIDLDQEAKLDPLEREANEFAIEVLLPRRCLEERFRRTTAIDIDFIAKLSDEAATSLQATAIRVARRSSDRICVLLVEGGRVSWAVASDDWRHAKLPAGALKGRPLPVGSASARSSADFREERLPLRTWATNQPWRDEDVYESALVTPYGRLVFLGAEAEEEDR